MHPKPSSQNTTQGPVRLGLSLGKDCFKPKGTRQVKVTLPVTPFFWNP